MTVSELITKLEAYPQNAQVFIAAPLNYDILVNVDPQGCNLSSAYCLSKSEPGKLPKDGEIFVIL